MQEELPDSIQDTKLKLVIHNGQFALEVSYYHNVWPYGLAQETKLFRLTELKD